MKKAKLIFGSASELKAFETIHRHLPLGWRLYTNLPLSRIVEIERSELTDKKWDFYLKSSVDFVLADKNHEPTLAIEFDGLGHGYTAGKRYLSEAVIPNDPYRDLKLTFKIDTCYEVGLPLIVISFEEIKPIGSDDLLSIVNGMIGMHIVAREHKETIAIWDREGLGVGKSFDELLWDDCNLLSRLRVKYDPFLARLVEIEEEYAKLGARWSMTPVSNPDIVTALREQKYFESVGAKFIVEGGVLPSPVIVTVWVRNFAGSELGYDLSGECAPSHGINPLKVAENIGWYLSHKKAVEIARRDTRRSSTRSTA